MEHRNSIIHITYYYNRKKKNHTRWIFFPSGGGKMEYTVRNLLEGREFPEMQLICGEKGLERNISGIRIIEIQDMAKYLIGGEILLTSLYVYENCPMRTFRMYLQKFLKKNISGFIIKKRKGVDKKDRKLEILKEYCIQNNIPLIEIPSELYYWEIIQYVMNQVYTEEVARLKYFKITHDNFNALSFKDDFTYDKTQEVLDLLGSMLNNPVALYYGNWNCYKSTNSANRKFVLLDNLEEYTPDIITKFQYSKQQGEYTQYIVNIQLFGQIRIYLVITEETKKLSLLDYMAIENAIITLQYGFLSTFAQNELERKYHRDIIHNILNDSLNKDELIQAANLLGFQNECFYRVVVFYTIRKNIQNKYTEEQLREIGVIEGEIITLFPQEAIYRNMNQIVMIQKIDPEESEEQYREQMEKMQDTVQDTIISRKKNTKLKVGIGRIVKGIRLLHESYKEATKAISYIDIVKEVSDNKNKSVIFYSDLGFFRILGEMENPAEMLKYIPESLQCLYSYEKSDRDELLLTLKTYLDNNQSISKTAQELYVHYKTVSYRLNKIAKITKMDYKESNEMLNVRIGLIICKMVEKIK